MIKAWHVWVMLIKSIITSMRYSKYICSIKQDSLCSLLSELKGSFYKVRLTWQVIMVQQYLNVCVVCIHYALRKNLCGWVESMVYDDDAILISSFVFQMVPIHNTHNNKMFVQPMFRMRWRWMTLFSSTTWTVWNELILLVHIGF